MRKSKLTRKQKSIQQHTCLYYRLFRHSGVLYCAVHNLFYQKPVCRRYFCGHRKLHTAFSKQHILLALKNTGIFTVTAIPLLMVISFLIALFLNSFNKISSFFRSALLIPVVVPIASLICVWQLVLMITVQSTDYLIHLDLILLNF